MRSFKLHHLSGAAQEFPVVGVAISEGAVLSPAREPGLLGSPGCGSRQLTGIWASAYTSMR